MCIGFNNPLKVVSEPKGVGVVLKGGGTGSTYFFIVDVGDDPSYVPVPRGV